MQSRHRQLEQILETLSIATTDLSVATRQEVQSVVFLTQLMGQTEQPGSPDLATQSGYFFKWYGRPYSPRLNEVHRQLVEYVRHGVSGGDYVHDDRSFTREPHVRKIVKQVQLPQERNVSRPKWYTMLAITAYLRVGADWSRAKAEDEVGQLLGEDYREYFEDAERQLSTLGLQSSNVETLEIAIRLEEANIRDVTTVATYKSVFGKLLSALENLLHVQISPAGGGYRRRHISIATLTRELEAGRHLKVTVPSYQTGIKKPVSFTLVRSKEEKTGGLELVARPSSVSDIDILRKLLGQVTNEDLPVRKVR